MDYEWLAFNTVIHAVKDGNEFQLPVGPCFSEKVSFAFIIFSIEIGLNHSKLIIDT